MANTAFILNGQVGLLPSDQQAAGSGNYFIVSNPTPGTAIAYALQTTFSATANGLFSIKNTEQPGGKSIYLDYLKLIQTATAPATTLAMRFEAYNETGAVALTGNVATRTPVAMSQTYTVPSTITVQSFAAGAATVPAAVGTRVLQGVASIPTGVAVAQDTYILQFGAGKGSTGIAGLTAARATDPATIAGQMGPVVVAPQTTSWLNMWWVTATTNAPSFEFELGLYMV